jgi:hypothetical protein
MEPLGDILGDERRIAAGTLDYDKVYLQKILKSG